MRIIKRFEEPLFVRWVRQNLPDSLRVVTWYDGYGVSYKIKTRFYLSSTIAYIDDADSQQPRIRLRRNNYLSDMEDLCRQWESEFAQEAILEYWPSIEKVPPKYTPAPPPQGGRALED